ncbi:MAG: hypothetical protein FJ109_09020 [Deltaproteobacteria bacterium]|nr:hypothetical protein [Deltaproteobacteria bacterium]
MTGRIRARAAGVGIAFFFLLSPAALALPSPFPVSVAPGDDYSEVLARCRTRVGADKVTELFADRFGDLVPALVDSGMLAMLNRARARHSLFQKPGGRKVSFLRVSGGGEEDNLSFEATLAFAAGKLEGVLVVVRVAPDAAVGGALNPFSSERLAPILGYRKALGRECSLSPADKGSTNRFDFTGKCGGFKAWVEYRPAEDLFVILLYQ